MKIDSHKIICDFCGGKHSFKDLKQVPLRIDKTSRVQYLFGFICPTCVEAGKRKTTENQQIRSFTGKSKDKNEQSVFDSGEDEDV